MAVRVENSVLSPDQVKFYHDMGYLGPFELCSIEEMGAIRQRIDQILFREGIRHKQQHVHCRVVYDLCTHPAILDRVECILGPDILLWQSRFVVKKPGDREITWHQDANYWGIEPAVNVSAWIAIDEATVENSAVQLLPGTHKKVIPHVKAPQEAHSPQQADSRYFEMDPNDVVDMELKPGQFFLFTERVLHHSNANRSDKRRLGLAVRLTHPIVRCNNGRNVILVRGQDYMGFNALSDPPK